MKFKEYVCCDCGKTVTLLTEWPGSVWHLDEWPAPNGELVTGTHCNACFKKLQEVQHEQKQNEMRQGR